MLFSSTRFLNTFKRHVLAIVLILSGLTVWSQNGVSISENGNQPDPSAMLDIQSGSRGILIPRLTTNARTNMNNPAPATGLLVYDTDYNSFWYYDGLDWVDIKGSSVLEDMDMDTKIQVEETPDEDIIRFDVAGVEVMRHDGKTLHAIAPGGSLFIGRDAGLNDDGTNDGVDNENTFIGVSAGYANTTGIANTFLGNNAGAFTTTGTGNTFLGHRAGLEVENANSNTFLGASAGYHNVAGDNNFFVGYRAGYNNDQVGGNHFAGYEAGLSNTTGDKNMFIGYQSGMDNTTGVDNLFVGRLAGASNTTTSHNLMIGQLAGAEASTTIGYNTFLGNNAGRVSDGFYNLYMGVYAGEESQGDYNQFVGANCGQYNQGSANHFAGWLAGAVNEGDENHFTGLRAGDSNTTGYQNYFSGYFAGHGNIAGAKNHFVGYNAGRNNTSSWNHFTGYRAGENNTTGTNNYFSGLEAGFSNTEGFNNTYIGFKTGHSNTDGYYNTAVGKDAFMDNAHGSHNTCVGYESGSQSLDHYNTYIGSLAGETIVQGTGMTIVGAQAGRNFIGDCTKNTFIGNGAGVSAAGTYNTFLGANTGQDIDGMHNVFVGYSAGENINSGNFNTFIGTETGAAHGKDSTIVIGHSAYTSLNSSAAIGDGTKYFGMGISPDANSIMKFSATTATLTLGGVWQNASDRNLKENFVTLDGATILEKVATLPVTEWNYIKESDSIRHIGPMAQDFYAIFGLGGDDKSISTIDPAGVALVAIQALYEKQQELEHMQARTVQLESELQEQKAEIADIRMTLAALQAPRKTQ